MQRTTSSGIAYDLKYQARCICDVRADAETTSFLAGTLSLKEENEIHLIRISPSGTELTCKGIFSHPNEIWHLASCPFDPRTLSTVFDSGGAYGAAVWQIPDDFASSSSPQLEQTASLDAHSCEIRSVLWWPSGKHDKLVSIDKENLFLWSLDSSTKSAKVQSQESVGMLHYLTGGAWDPHNQNAVAVTCESSSQCWDLRSMKRTLTLDHAYARAVDYNPKKQHILVTAEYESGIRVWDIRMPNVPIRELPGHAHWTWSIQHNPEHHELILSSGTDSTVNLWFASVDGMNDATYERMPESPSQKVVPLICSFSDYEDCVYGLSWSCREPWIFASLSYDGRVVVESVKSYLPKH
ncbi:unnamed protein product [Victoria cruziana]